MAQLVESWVRNCPGWKACAYVALVWGLLSSLLLFAHLKILIHKKVMRTSKAFRDVWCFLVAGFLFCCCFVLFFFPFEEQWGVWSWFCNPKGQLRTSCTVYKPSTPEFISMAQHYLCFQVCFFVCLFVLEEMLFMVKWCEQTSETFLLQ